MARKVFISVLGTGYYGKCVYEYNGERATESRFIQCATLQLLTRSEEWTSSDHAYVLLTERAKSTNWHVEGNVRDNRGVQEEYIGLKEEFSRMNLPFEVEPVDIADGKNEAEIWSIFDSVFNVIEEGDELYFDLTHGFRYLPMLVLVLGNYAKFLRGVKIKSITYGNFEMANKAAVPVVAPVIDITSLSALQDWTVGVSDYLRHGDTEKIMECSNQKLKPLLRESKGSDKAASKLNGLCISLKALSEAIRFCRGVDLCEGSAAQKILEYLDGADENYLKPLVPLFSELKSAVENMNTDDAENMIKTAEMSASNGNYQSAVTLLEEGIVTMLCSRYGIDKCDVEKRKWINEALGYKYFCRLQKNKKDKSPKFEDYVAKGAFKRYVLQDKLINDDLASDFNLLTNVRNDFNHSGMRNKPLKPMVAKDMKKNISECINRFKSFTAEYKKADYPTFSQVQNSDAPRLFINLSNHPRSQWSEAQLAAAVEIGEYKEMAFPSVDPDADDKTIDSLADQCCKDIVEMAETAQVTVHVMGEMSLTYRIVKRLTEKGIRCVCSTTERICSEGENGERTYMFNFKRFRDYGK